jgi:hypothetical protein
MTGRDLKATTMRTIMNGVLLALLLAAPANAQVNPQPTPVPTPRLSTSPFGSDWAKPFPQTGGYFYNDPRLQNQPLRPNGVCPSGFSLNRSTGSCHRVR